MQKRAINLFIIAILVIVVALAIAIYFFFQYSKECSDRECFNSYLEKCQRVFFVNNDETSIAYYSILGAKAEDCQIRVKIIQVKQGAQELSSLENQEMICSIPLGSKLDPLSNLNECHGVLKEKIQEIIIKRLHSQILTNLGQIANETTKVL